MMSDVARFDRLLDEDSSAARFATREIARRLTSRHT
jgi:hypothetical protein